MKTRSMVMMAVVALVVTAAAPASAKKGAPGPPDASPVGGYTCAEIAPAGPAVTWEGSSRFSFTMDGDDDFACVDVLAPAGVWTVTVVGSGARELLLIPRDSYRPGDLCAEARMRDEAIYGEWTLPLPGDPLIEIPAATVNACGVEYGEWIGGELVMEQHPEVPHPLALHAFFRGTRQAAVTVYVDLPTLP